MAISTRGRIFFARHRWAYWFVVVSVAAIAATLVHRQLDAVEHERQRWGDTRPVWVATEDLAVDAVPSVRQIRLPVAAIPPTAVTDDPTGGVLRQHVSAGEIVVAADVARSVVDRAATGFVVVRLPAPAGPPPPVGQMVRVVAEGLVLADDAEIVAVADEVVMVAVEAADAPIVAHAAVGGTAALVFVP